ncbi:MAG: hypothetical protein Q9216_004482 [Gyalolechia sp. 2 TL-2023]
MATATYTPRRGDPKSMNDQAIPWTEQIARHRPKAPTRRLSASEEIRPSRHHVRRQGSAVTDGWREKDRHKGDDNSANFFGFSGTTKRPARMSDASSPFKKMNSTSIFTDDGSNVGLGKASSSMLPIYSDSFSPERPQKTLRFADEIEMSDDSDGEEPSTMSLESLDQQKRHAFAMHALNQGYGGGLRNAFAGSALGRANAAQEPSAKLRLTLRPRTLILGHKAGLWLKDYSFTSFCGLAEALMTHDWQTFGYPTTFKAQKRFTVEIAGSKDTKSREYPMTLSHHASRRTYDTKIRPILQGNDPKPDIRVRTEMNSCGFDCDCDDSRELEVEALDMGFLTILAEWHRWEDKARASNNSLIFATIMFDLLFPAPAFNDHDEYDMELPDGQTFHLVRGMNQLLSAEVQEQLSHITTKDKQAGVKPNKIKVWPSNRFVLDRPQASPSQISPSMARAEGTIFVHRPARSTLFRYDVPHTMERFFELARSELYPETDGELRLRISPSGAFRNEGELLTVISERKNGYIELDGEERTLEEWWKQEVVDKWLFPDEDVWAIKIFDTVRVFDGTRNDKAAEFWDTSALGSVEQEKRAGPHEEWNVPPESIMTELATISKELLNIDPRVSPKGILLHVVRDTPTGSEKEWLQWGPKQSFVQFMLEVLYKIDGDAIAIYPGDYVNLKVPFFPLNPHDETADQDQEESNDSTEMRMRETAENMRRKRIQDQAVRVLYQRPTQPLFGAISDADADRSVQRAQSPFPPFSTARGGFAQSLSANRSPGRNYFAEALSPSKRSGTPDIERLRQRLERAEDEILFREESCKVCGMVFVKSSPAAEDAIREHYRSHAAPAQRSCPQEGCPENLEDRILYPSHQAGNHSTYIKPRGTLSEVHQEMVRETATQTDPAQDFEEPKPNSNDSLNDKPGEHSKRLCCDKCNHIMNDLSEMGRAAHAKDCRTSVENFETITIRPGKAMFGLNQDYISNKYQKTETKRKGKAQRQNAVVETPAETPQGEDNTPASPSKTKGRTIRLTSKRTVRRGVDPQPSTLPTVTEEVSAEMTTTHEAAPKAPATTTTSKPRSGSLTPAAAPSYRVIKSTTSRATRSGSAPASLAITAHPPSAPPTPPKRGRKGKTPAPSTAAAEPKTKPARKPRATKAKPDAGTGASTLAPIEETTKAAPPPQPRPRKPRAKKAKPEDSLPQDEPEQADAAAAIPKKAARKPRAAKGSKTELAADETAPAPKPAARKPRAKKANVEAQVPESQGSAKSGGAKAKPKAKAKETSGEAAAERDEEEEGEMDEGEDEEGVYKEKHDEGEKEQEKEAGEQEEEETPAATAVSGTRKRKPTSKVAAAAAAAEGETRKRARR